MFLVHMNHPEYFGYFYDYNFSSSNSKDYLRQKRIIKITFFVQHCKELSETFERNYYFQFRKFFQSLCNEKCMVWLIWDWKPCIPFSVKKPENPEYTRIQKLHNNFASSKSKNFLCQKRFFKITLFVPHSKELCKIFQKKLSFSFR